MELQDQPGAASRRPAIVVTTFVAVVLGLLLSASPAVIYSFRATGDYAPTFVS